MFLGRDGFIWWIGVVEYNQDPLILGRAKVRIFGYHDNASTGEMPTADLPWAITLMPANMPGAYGIPNLGDWVIGFFLDGEDAQEPCILGYIPGIPPGTIPTDIKERFSEQISTVRSFNTVSNILNSVDSQKDRFRFEQSCGNSFEMINDTAVDNPIAITHGSTSTLVLSKGSIVLTPSTSNQRRGISINENGAVLRDWDIGVFAQGKILSTSEENTFRLKSALANTTVNLPGYGTVTLGARQAIGSDNRPSPITVGGDTIEYYHPSASESNALEGGVGYDTVNLVRDVRLLMNTVFPPDAKVIKTTFITPPINAVIVDPGIVESGEGYTDENGNFVLLTPGATELGDGGGSGGADCFLGETLVTMFDGSKKRIDQIKDGDYVFNMNRTEVNTVLFIEIVPDKYNWQELYSPSAEFAPFATPNHPLFINGEWVALEQGLYPWLDKVKPVKNPITRKTEDELVYNLWVSGDGTYIVNGFGTTSIMMDGGIMRVCYQNGYLSQDDIVKLMREFTTQGMTYGSYLFNKVFGYVTYKPIVKIMASTIKREKEFLPRKAMIFLMKVFGKTATFYNKLKG